MADIAQCPLCATTDVPQLSVLATPLISRRAQSCLPRSKSTLGRRPPAVISPLLRHALGRRIGRQGEPGVACLLPHRDGRRGEIRVGEVAYGNSDVSRKAFALPINGGAACRTEMKGQRVATFGCPH